MTGFLLFNLAITIKPLFCNTVIAVVKPKSSLHYVGCLEQVVREQFVADSTDSFKILEASVSLSLKIFELTASLNRSALSGSHLNTVRCSFLLLMHFEIAIVRVI